ncbi:MAG: Na(+)/H(+) antiporter subunit B [Zestosphaera sp.]
MRKRIEVIIPILLGTGLYLLLYMTGLLTMWKDLTTLASKYLKMIPDILNPYTSASYEVVTSVIWDQRGFDTFFETTVLFLAIIAAVGLFDRVISQDVENHRMTLIPRLAVRVLAPVTVIVSVSVAVHGHISPGGGFQGGVVFVMAPLMFMLAFSSGFILRAGFKSDRLMVMRGFALSLIALTGLIPLIYGYTKSVNAYLFQNLLKPDSSFTYPAWVDIGPIRILLSGSLILYNVFEYVAVFAGFTVALYLLTKVFEEGVKK